MITLDKIIHSIDIAVLVGSKNNKKLHYQSNAYFHFVDCVICLFVGKLIAL